MVWSSGATLAREPVFLAGADMSHVQFFEDRGAVYRENGQPANAFEILRRQGLNCVRLRLFTSSAAQAAADPYNAINNLDYTLPLARRARAAGHQLLLNFHYSDSWADPGKQRLPAAWTNLSFSELLGELRAYNSNVLASFAAAGIVPEYVQVGNEITQGMLWPHGHVGGTNDTPLQWAKLGQLLRAAIQGIRDAVPTGGPQIMIHIDRGGDWAGTRWFFDRLQAQNVPFDLIGLSYYPFWHGSLTDLRNTLTNAALRYRKPIVVVETAFPFSGSTNVWGIPATTNGQVEYVIALAEVVNSVPLRLGRGIFWWGAEYQSLPGYRLAGFDLRSLFGPGGNVLPAAAALGRLTTPLRLEARLAEPELLLSWPLSGAGFSLVSATSLAPHSLWHPVTAPVLAEELQYHTRVPLEDGPRFFRLQ
ncbi:glycoside hydrolase family 53 protein [Limisphaera sp. VF-2]|jgi:arabinogalactan endo-1,4-beta-galactosidase|uniref:glycoside hydrolase family 53 protein n=1 Tax=Limisphaera sp. VF-2 TaxID=3400418 RepID=UPI003C20ACB5